MAALVVGGGLAAAAVLFSRQPKIKKEIEVAAKTQDEVARSGMLVQPKQMSGVPLADTVYTQSDGTVEGTMAAYADQVAKRNASLVGYDFRHSLIDNGPANNYAVLDGQAVRQIEPLLAQLPPDVLKLLGDTAPISRTVVPDSAGPSMQARRDPKARLNKIWADEYLIEPVTRLNYNRAQSFSRGARARPVR